MKPTPRLLALLFAVYGLIGVSALVVLVPPFQAADEATHLSRADQVERGWPVARRIEAADTAGGRVDAGIAAVDGALAFLRAGRDTRVDPALSARLKRVPLGTPADASFPNTALYPPMFYLPDALGIATAKGIGLGTVGTLRLARLVNGMVAVLIGGWAIARGRRLAPALLFVLTLPMSFALFASAAQDGPLVACAALAVSLLGAPPAGGRGRCGAVVLAAGLLGLVAMARPPYAPLLPLVPLFAAAGMRRGAAGCVAVAGLAVAGWTLAMDRWVMARPVAVAIHAQMAVLGRHPGMLLGVPAETVAVQLRHGLPWLREMIGVLGWLDVLLPRPVYLLAVPVGVVAFAVSRADGPEGVARPVAVGTLVVGSAVGILWSIYLSWTATGAAAVDGVQGRYFLPLLAAAALALPKGGGSGRKRWAMAGWVPALFPCLSIVASVRAVAARYYGV